MVHDFKHATLGRSGLHVVRMGFSASYFPGRKAIQHAFDAGVNYFFGYGTDLQLTSFIRSLSPSDRRTIVLATGAYNYIWARQDVRKTLEKRLRQFRTDSIDVFLFLGVMKPQEFPPEVLQEMMRLKEEGHVKAIGLSCHHRAFVGQLAASGAVDVVMMRYNAAHRGAEEQIFPHVGTHHVGVVSYTATRWTGLLRRPRSWPKNGRIPTAPEAYRFVLGNPNIDVCLMAPTNLNQTKQDLDALDQGPLSPDDSAFMTQFGDAVHDQKRWFM